MKKIDIRPSFVMRVASELKYSLKDRAVGDTSLHSVHDDGKEVFYLSVFQIHYKAAVMFNINLLL